MVVKFFRGGMVLAIVDHFTVANAIPDIGRVGGLDGTNILTQLVPGGVVCGDI